MLGIIYHFEEKSLKRKNFFGEHLYMYICESSLSFSIIPDYSGINRLGPPGLQFYILVIIFLHNPSISYLVYLFFYAPLLPSTMPSLLVHFLLFFAYAQTISNVPLILSTMSATPHLLMSLLLVFSIRCSIFISVLLSKFSTFLPPAQHTARCSTGLTMVLYSSHFMCEWWNKNAQCGNSWAKWLKGCFLMSCLQII